MTGRAWSIPELEGHLFRGWPPARVEHIGGWRCGLDRGVTRRPNSIWPIAWDGSLALEDAIARTEALYRDAGLDPCFRIMTGAAPPELEDALAARGYAAEGPSRVLVATLSPHPAPADDILFLEAPNEPWLACYESELKHEAERQATRALFGRITERHVFGAAVVDGVTTSTALAVATEGWAQISAVRTLPAWRRRGLAERVLAALAAWARRQGAANLILAVEAGNTPAERLYRKAGFRHEYDYRYRAVRTAKA
jgi:ribosomal protein S18 acetylase RimI-like enzyme